MLMIWETIDVDPKALISDLLKICPHLQLRLQLGLEVGPAGMERKNGLVTYAGIPAFMDIGDTLVQALIDDPVWLVGIRGVRPDTEFSSPGTGKLSDVGGVVCFDPDPNGTNAVVIVYDPTDCNGAGQWVEGERPGQYQPLPTYVVLFHELYHALQVFQNRLNPDQPATYEKEAIQQENEFRRSLSLGRRGTHQGGCNPPPTSTPPAANAPDEKAKDGCFIATAAFDSPIAPEVQLLRHFRDDVLRHTRSGNAFFENFFSVYYQFSPLIVDCMASDPRIKQMVRWIAVTPIVRYLELLLNFPDQSSEHLSEPWRSFVDEIRTNLELWADAIPLPDSFSGLSPRDAVEELGLALRYILRTDARREEYLSRLDALGQIPIHLSKDESAGCTERLRALGRPDSQINRILDIQAPSGSGSILSARGAAREVMPIAGNMNPALWMYTVTIRNNSTLSIAVVLFYKRLRLDGCVYLASSVIPSTYSACFQLGPADQMESYAFGIYEAVQQSDGSYIEGDMMMSLGTANDEAGGPVTPAVARRLNPADTEPFADSWQWSES